MSGDDTLTLDKLLELKRRLNALAPKPLTIVVSWEFPDDGATHIIGKDEEFILIGRSPFARLKAGLESKGVDLAGGTVNTVAGVEVVDSDELHEPGRAQLRDRLLRAISEAIEIEERP